MALPNSYTYSLRDTANELQVLGFPSLSTLFTCAPLVSYDSTYSGTTSCLRNFRHYALYTGWTTTTLTRPRQIAFDGTNAWTPNYDVDSVSKITPNGIITDYVCPTCLNCPYGIAFDGTNMWVTNYGSDSITKVTPAGAMTTYSVGNGPSTATFDGTNIWTGDFQGSTVSKVTLAGSVTTYGVSTNPVSIGNDGTNIWVGLNNDTYSKITQAGTETNYNNTPTRPNGWVWDGGSYMWTGNNAGGGWSKITISTGAATNYGTGLSFYTISSDGTYFYGGTGSGVNKVRMSDGARVRIFTHPVGGAYGNVVGNSELWLGNLSTNCVQRMGIC